ncbi:von Willebrand factor D and EGF domain-containing protein-like [Saccoglossus kowalevskii]
MMVSNTDVTFQCDPRNTITSGRQFHFKWYANDIIIREESTSEKVSTLFQTNWIGYMGYSIHCAVEITENGVVIDTKTSGNLFAGVKINIPFGDVIELDENSDAVTIELESTVPLLCVDDVTDCELVIPVMATNRVGTYYGEYPEIVIKEDCGIRINPSNTVDGASFSLTVKARRDFFKDGNGTIVVHDRDSIRRKCSSGGDPHYYTCDGIFYNVYMPGEYIFYKHETMPYEIQTRLSACGSVACNCGVAVRVEDDIIIVDRCNIEEELVSYFWAGRKYEYYRSTSKLLIEVLVTGDLTEGFRLISKNSGHTHVILLPTGAYIEILGSYFLDIFYSPATEDYGFENAGLTPQGNNLFYGELDDIPSVGVYLPEVFCTCSPNDGNTATVNQQCGFNKEYSRSYSTPDDANLSDCDAHWCDITYDYTKNLQEVKKRRRRRRRSGDNQTFFFVYDSDFVSSVPSWPTSSGINETTAELYCEDIVKNTPAGIECSTVLSLYDIDKSIEGCKTDILVLDYLSAGDNAADFMKGQCQAILLTDPVYWELHDGVLAPPSTILSLLCPADCSGHGTCVNALCDCETGYGGTDCRVDMTQPPQVYTAHHSGVCDIDMESCQHITIYGVNFVESEEISCHIRPIEVQFLFLYDAEHSYIIIGTVLGSSVIVIILVAIVIIIIMKKKNKAKIAASDEWSEVNAK